MLKQAKDQNSFPEVQGTAQFAPIEHTELVHAPGETIWSIDCSALFNCLLFNCSFT